MSGRTDEAGLVSAPKQRNTDAEKKAVKEGRIPEDWKAKPAELRQKDRDARWTLVFGKARLREDGGALARSRSHARSPACSCLA